MTVENKTRKIIYICLLVYMPVFVLFILYDLMANWDTLTRHKVILWLVQLVSVVILLPFFYVQYKKLK